MEKSTKFIFLLFFSFFIVQCSGGQGQSDTAQNVEQAPTKKVETVLPEKQEVPVEKKKSELPEAPVVKIKNIDLGQGNIVAGDSELALDIAGKKQTPLVNTKTTTYLNVSVDGEKLLTYFNSKLEASQTKNWVQGWKLSLPADITRIDALGQGFEIQDPNNASLNIKELQYYDQKGSRVNIIQSISGGRITVSLIGRKELVDKSIAFEDITKIFTLIFYEDQEGEAVYTQMPPIYIQHYK